MASKPKTNRRKHPVTGCRTGALLGQWAIEPSRFRRYYDMAMRTDLAALAERNRASADAVDGDEAGPGYEMLDNGIARVLIHGPMTKYTTSFDLMFGGCSSLVLRNIIRRAA